MATVLGRRDIISTAYKQPCGKIADYNCRPQAVSGISRFFAAAYLL
jgi:hypothetical protein